MKIRKNGKTITLTEGEIKKIVQNKKEVTKFKKNGKVISLNESEIKEIVNKHKINRFLTEDRESRRADDKKLKVGSIIVKLTTLSNMLKSTKYNLESIATLHKIEEFLEKQIEDFEDKIEGEKAKQLSKDLN